MFSRRFALLLCLVVLGAASALAQNAYTPQTGSPERKAIVDAIRGPAEKEIGFNVIFKVDVLKVGGKWAFARVVPIHPDGSAINWNRTKFGEVYKNGGFDPQGEALLRRDGDDWRVVEWKFGGTDASGPYWAGKYRLPKGVAE
jgi:hypothetical protein